VNAFVLKWISTLHPKELMVTYYTERAEHQHWFWILFWIQPFRFVLFSSKYDDLGHVISTYFLSKELCSCMGGMVSTITMK